LKTKEEDSQLFAFLFSSLVKLSLSNLLSSKWVEVQKQKNSGLVTLLCFGCTHSYVVSLMKSGETLCSKKHLRYLIGG
jgi:hypothetical protein